MHIFRHSTLTSFLPQNTLMPSCRSTSPPFIPSYLLSIRLNSPIAIAGIVLQCCYNKRYASSQQNTLELGLTSHSTTPSYSHPATSQRGYTNPSQPLLVSTWK